MQKINYQLQLDETLEGLAGKTPSLLLHACCAPCSSYVLEYLSEYFSITLLYYNPNISPEEEYQKRLAEVRRLISELPVKNPVAFREGKYDPERFFAMSRGMEQEPEGGARCMACYALRLEETALCAVAEKFDFFTTTLSISPYKNAAKLNEIGGALADKYGVPYLFSDFKKRGGYQRSIELSRRYDLYRQKTCGCVFSAARAPMETSSQRN